MIAVSGFLAGRGTVSANHALISLVDDLAHSLGGTPYSATGWRLEGQPLGDRFYGLLIKDPCPEILHLGKKLPHL